jgi:hypothetical protein
LSGIGPYSFPAAPTSSSGVTPQDQATQLDRLYGRDLWFDVRKAAGGNYEITPAGDWKVVAGRECLRQAIVRRIITDPGEWAQLPEYGVGARMFVKGRNTRAARDELAERIRAQLIQDPRIESVETVDIEILADMVRISVKVQPRGRSLKTEAVTASVEVT